MIHLKKVMIPTMILTSIKQLLTDKQTNHKKVFILDYEIMAC